MHLISNLSTISIEVLINLISKGNTLQVTLDSLEKEKNDKTRGAGSYELTKSFFSELSEDKLKKQIQLRFNLNKTNLNEIQNVIDFALNNGLNHLTFAFLVKSGRAIKYPYLFDYEDDLIELKNTVILLKKLKQKYKSLINIVYSSIEEQVGCVFFKNGKISFSPRIDSEGNVYLCQLFVDVENSIGNLKNDGLSDILISTKAIDFVRKLRLRKEKNEKCSDCAFSKGCMCGCPAISYLNTGNIMNISDQCKMIKFFYKEKIKLSYEK